MLVLGNSEQLLIELKYIEIVRGEEEAEEEAGEEYFLQFYIISCWIAWSSKSYRWFL